MSVQIRYLATIFVTAGTAGVIIMAPTAAAKPECINTTPTTTVCTTNGHSSMTTSPPLLNYGPFGWPYYGGGYNFGGIRFG